MFASYIYEKGKYGGIMKRKLVVLAIALSFILSSCETVDNIPSDNSTSDNINLEKIEDKIEYVEIDAKDYTLAVARDLAGSGKGAKLKNVRIIEADIDSPYPSIKIKPRGYPMPLQIDVRDYLVSNPNAFAEVENLIKNDEKYNGNLTLYIILPFFNIVDNVVLHKIEGYPTVEQIQESKEQKELEEERTKKEEAKKGRLERYALLVNLCEVDKKAREIAGKWKKLEFHDTNETPDNTKKFYNKTLRQGHAYIIRNFVTSDYSDELGLVYGYSDDSRMIDYIDLDVRDDVLNSCGWKNTLFGKLAVTTDVVVTGSSTGSPIVQSL